MPVYPSRPKMRGARVRPGTKHSSSRYLLGSAYTRPLGVPSTLVPDAEIQAAMKRLTGYTRIVVVPPQS